jgi:diguanylate cyclase (GGDEF)-like protein
MSEDEQAVVGESHDLEQEIERLRGEVARLQQEVEQLDRMAHEDALVPLPNRRGFMRQLDSLIHRVNRYGEAAALLFVDIDGLKMINDSFGHPAGDEALIKVSELLQGGVRASDCVARIGGDEFAILLEHAEEASARDTAARLADEVARCGFEKDGAELPLSVAIGVALIGPDDDADEVIARADAEMYRAKEGS